MAEIERTNPQILEQVKDHAWRRIFWMSMPPGILFVLGGFFVSESPRWLFRKGKKSNALEALRRSRTEEQAAFEMNEMEQIAREGGGAQGGTQTRKREPLLQRRYILPFLLACVILSCNTATGINSVIGFNTNILLQSGLDDVSAHWGYVVFTFCNFLFTIVGMTLVDRKGRKFLFTLGTSGIIVAMVCTGVMFVRSEAHRYDVRETLQAQVKPDQSLTFPYDAGVAQRLLPAGSFNGERTSLAVIYSYGDFTGTTNPVRTGEAGPATIEIKRAESVPAGKVQAFFSNPVADLDAARTAPLKIEHAYISPVPSVANGWVMAMFLYMFVAFYASGPGVCVWLALSELMPTRIRSNGMSVALVVNQLVSTMLAAVFLPVVGKYGYSRMFFLFASFTVCLPADRCFLPARDEGENAGGDRKAFRGGLSCSSYPAVAKLVGWVIQIAHYVLRRESHSWPFFRPLRGLTNYIHPHPAGSRLGLPSGARFAGFCASRSEVEAEFGGQRARRHIVGSTEGGEEVVERVVVSDIDRGEPKAPFVLVAVEEVVGADGGIEQVAGSDARGVLVVVFGVGRRDADQAGSELGCQARGSVVERSVLPSRHCTPGRPETAGRRSVRSGRSPGCPLMVVEVCRSGCLRR